MTDHQQPQNTVQAVSEVAGQVVTGLYANPLLLGIVVLNCIGIAAALYFLSQLSTNNAKHIGAIMDQHQKQFETVLRLCVPSRGPGAP